jgi:hypothetical protein
MTREPGEVWAAEALEWGPMDVGRNDPCPCGSGKKFKRCCLDKPALKPAPVPDTRGASSGLMLTVETERGWVRRVVPPAMPLRLQAGGGYVSEDAVTEAASLWGLPDFVYRPALRREGTRRRELGDGVILLGDIGVVMQVKRRETPSANEHRERSWITKKAMDALRQGRGTVRELKREPASMVNGRGRSVRVDGNDRRWVVAVIIDHDQAPEAIEPVAEGDLEGAVVLLRKDWEFLFDQLKSTHAVVQYLGRVAGEPHALGLEAARYYYLAGLDAKATPGGVPQVFLDIGGRPTSEPMLPMAPAARLDRDQQLVYRSILEDAAEGPLNGTPEEDRLRILASLDAVPIVTRGELGRFAHHQLAELTSQGTSDVLWRFRRVVGEGSTQLAFAACSHPHEKVGQGFTSWVHLRHHEFTQRLASGSDGPVTIGVLLTPRMDGRRPWDTTLYSITGVFDLDAAEYAAATALWRDDRTAATAGVDAAPAPSPAAG